MDTRSLAVTKRKVNFKVSSSKHRTESSSAFGANTLNFADIKPRSIKLKSQLHARPNPEPVTKTIQKCNGLELTSQPALPVAVDKSQVVATPLGTPVYLYPANSFPSGDSSLASLPSLIQNIVCNSHGAIMKPLSSAPGFSSSTRMYCPSKPVTHASLINNGTLRGSVAAALPVLSSQLSAVKPILIPFHISHMNYLNESTKYPCTSSCLMPSRTPALKPIEPSMSSSQQRPLSQLYHRWGTTSHEKDPASGTAIVLSHLHNSSTVSDISFTNSNDRKIYGHLLLSSSPGPPRLEIRPCSNSEALNYQTMLPENVSLNPEIKTSMYSSNCFLSTSTTTITLDSNYVPSSNLAIKNPHKKRLTSLLSSKTINYSESSLRLLAGNSHDSQIFVNEAKLDDKCYAHTNLPSPTCVVSTQDSESLQPSNAKKKRFDKSRTHLVCSMCDLLFYSGTDLLVHRYDQHSHVCGECDGRFLSVARLKQHKDSDHPVMMICSICRFHTFNKQGLIDHQRLAHRNEIDSAGDSNITSREITKASSNVNLTMDSLSYSSQMQPGCTSSPSNKNNTPDVSIASIKTNENVDLSIVSVNMVNDPDTSEDNEYKLSSTSPALNNTRQVESKPNEPFFTSFMREQGIKQQCDIAPSNAIFETYELCMLDSVQSTDQQISETHEPKLVIDTGKCRSSRNVGDERKTRRKRAHSETKLDKYLHKCQANRQKTKSCPKDRKKHNKDYNGLNEKEGLSISKDIFDLMDMVNDPMNLSIPNDVREKFEMRISLQQATNDLVEHKTIQNNCTIKKSICSLRSDGYSNNLRAKLGNDGVDNKYCIQVKALSTEVCLGTHTGSTANAETCGVESAEKLHVRCPTKCTERENKLLYGTGGSYVDSQSASSDVAVSRASLSVCHAGTKQLAHGEKILPLLERHAPSSLPPKKRKFYFFDKSDIGAPQLTGSDHRSTNAIHRDINSIKGQENCIRRAESNSENVASAFERTLSCNVLEPLQLHKSVDRRYLCPVSNCVASFSRKWNLDAHINKIHAKLASVNCSVAGCQLIFSSKRDLRQHVTIDHKGKSRKYKCCWPECNKSFFARTHLRIHNLTHTGEKPVACGICDYRCRQRTALMWHMRKHGIFYNS